MSLKLYTNAILTNGLSIIFLLSSNLKSVLSYTRCSYKSPTTYTTYYTTCAYDCCIGTQYSPSSACCNNSFDGPWWVSLIILGFLIFVGLAIGITCYLKKRNRRPIGPVGGVTYPSSYNTGYGNMQNGVYTYPPANNNGYPNNSGYPYPQNSNINYPENKPAQPIHNNQPPPYTPNDKNRQPTQPPKNQATEVPESVHYTPGDATVSTNHVNNGDNIDMMPVLPNSTSVN